MKKTVFFIFCTFLCLSASGRQKTVYLSDYGSLADISATLTKAIGDIDGKRLILPSDSFDIGNLTIQGHKNFSIVGNSTIISCGDFIIKNSSDFEIKGIGIRGTVNKFAYFNIIGDCAGFTIHDCTFDSQKNVKGENMLYGIHVICDTSNPFKSYRNSPRHFSIYNNRVSNTRFDGILLHANCSDFDIYHNVIDKAGCIGVEVEGRLGGSNRSTTVQTCKNAKIYKNQISNCGDWGILLMWADSIEIDHNDCLNNYGSFLSIGSKNADIKDNIFEGTHKGFELSNEYYALSKGYNTNIKVIRNKIKGYPRAEYRGVVDIRHCRDILFDRNQVEAIIRDNCSMINITSSDDVMVKENRFMSPLTKKNFLNLRKGIALDPQTSEVVTFLKNDNIKVEHNQFDSYKK